MTLTIPTLTDKLNLLSDDDFASVQAVVHYLSTYQRPTTREVYSEMLRTHRVCMANLTASVDAPEDSLEKRGLFAVNQQAESEHAEFCEWARGNGFNDVYHAVRATLNATRAAQRALNGPWASGTLHQRITVRQPGMVRQEMLYRQWERQRPTEIPQWR